MKLQNIRMELTASTLLVALIAAAVAAGPAPAHAKAGAKRADAANCERVLRDVKHPHFAACYAKAYRTER